jgi:hypothetical protein
MKKLLFFIPAIIVSQLSKAQDKPKSFDSHNLVVSADYGFEAYSTQQQYTVQGLGTQKTINSSLSSTNGNLSAEFGLFKWLGIGIQGKLDNYSIAKDSNGYTPKAASGELGALLNIHLLRLEKIDLLVGVNVGFSTFNYSNSTNSFNYSYSGNGLWTDAHATLRYYFGRFGLNLSAYIPFTGYQGLAGSYSDWKTGQEVLNNWKNSGGGFSVGIQYRLF